MAKTVTRQGSKKATPSKKTTKQTATETTASQPSHNIIAIAKDKAFKTKEKVVQISDLLLSNKVTIDQLLQASASQQDVVKGTLLEAVEFASKQKPELINDKAFEFVIQSLKDDAPRVKWEAARVIGNTAQLFPKLLKKAAANLLANTEHTGTVVRWSAATALSKIISLSTPLNKELIPAAEAILEWETDNAVKKIYQKAIKNKIK